MKSYFCYRVCKNCESGLFDVKEVCFICYKSSYVYSVLPMIVLADNEEIHLVCKSPERDRVSMYSRKSLGLLERYADEEYNIDNYSFNFCNYQ